MKPKPLSAAERLADLATEAKNEGLDDVSHIIYQVKAGEKPEENLKALVKAKAKKDVLVATYAFLLNREKKDEEVSMLKPEIDDLASIENVDAERVWKMPEESHSGSPRQA